MSIRHQPDAPTASRVSDALRMVTLSDHVLAYRDAIRAGEHHVHRRDLDLDLQAVCDAQNLSWLDRAALLTETMCQQETPVLLDGEQIAFTRTIRTIPEIYSPQQMQELTQGHVLHELGPISNICADWEMLLRQGLVGRKEAALEAKKRFADDIQRVKFLDAAIRTIDAVLDLAERYATEAEAQGRDDLAELLRRVPARPANTFHEALQSLRLCHSVVWLSSHYHVGLGRFDQYMWPYLQADLEAGRLDQQQAADLLGEFFVSLNKDSDLYPGVQQGDNGQSLMLGGVKRDGSDGVNLLTHLSLRVACDLKLIDPKINLRVNSQTDLELLKLAAELTRAGLGFPQYSNDDVVLPALVAAGYDEEDARDYAVAACWEFLIPGRGMEIVNVGAVSMPGAVDRAIRKSLEKEEPFEVLLARTKEDIRDQVQKIAAEKATLLLPPAPYYSVLMTDLLEQGRNLADGAKYNNYGVHGACVSEAADALAAVQRHVYTAQTIQPQKLLAAMESNFQTDPSVRDLLTKDSPKIGNNNDAADRMMTTLFDYFAEACEQVTTNGRGGKIRPGTGSAMYYVWLATDDVHATADGRKDGDYFAANLAPSLGLPARGPISVLQSYSKIDYQRIYNGGPITIELSDSVFRDESSLEKVAMLIRAFAQLGCQQLQLNTLNSETLQDAKINPEQYRNLIVRVWGWSGYFCELGPEYQNQIIRRAKYSM